MANWGAFAGGLAKGYLAESELEETQKRTKAIQEEAAIRKDQEARAKEKFKWEQEAQARDQQYREGMKTIHDSISWVRNDAGEIDPLDPRNADNNSRLFGAEYTLRHRLGMLSPADQKNFMDYQEKLKGAETEKAAKKFLSTMNPDDLSGIDPSFKGAKIVTKQEKGQPPTTAIMKADGTEIPMHQVYGILGATGVHALQAKNVEEDNRRAAAMQTETERHNRAIEAISRANQTEKPTKEDKELERYFGTYKPTLPSAFKNEQLKPVSDDQGELIVRNLARNIMVEEKVTAGAAFNRASDILDTMNQKTLKLMGASRDPDAFVRLRRKLMDEAAKGGPYGPPASAARSPEEIRASEALQSKRPAAISAQSMPPGYR